MTPWTDSPLLMCLATILLFGAFALLPVMATEPLLIGIPALVPPAMVIPMTLLATATHMAAKTLVLLGSRKVDRVVPKRYQASLHRTCARLEGHRRLQLGTVFLSAVTGLPPFYVVTMACGVVRMSLRAYLVAGMAGRAMRFGAIVAAPQMLGL